MGFFSRIFSCCDRSIRIRCADTSGGYARVVVGIKVEPEKPSRRQSLRVAVPRGHSVTAIIRDSKAELTERLISIDEKDPADFESPTPSPYSSVISIPSTHLTALTSMHTGSTNVRNSWQSECAPPSYHSGRSSGLFPPPSSDSDHPVMNNNWLEILQRHAQEEAARTRSFQATRSHTPEVQQGHAVHPEAHQY